MSSPHDIIPRLHALLEQTYLLIDLFNDGLITEATLKLWLQAQWAVVQEAYPKIVERSRK